MSSGFSANQYENAFKSSKLQNWTLPKSFKERPIVTQGRTTFIATDQGYLLSGVKRGSAWPSFKGTWDLPKHIPPVNINPTARSQEGQERLITLSRCRLSSTAGMTDEAYGANRANNKTPHENTNTIDDAPDGLVPDTGRPDSCSSHASSRPLSQQGHAHSRPASQQSLAPSRPASQQSLAHSRPASQQSLAPSRPASQQGQAPSRPASQQGQAPSRPASEEALNPFEASQQNLSEPRSASKQSQA